LFAVEIDKNILPKHHS